MKTIKQGFLKGIGILLVFSTAVFAYTVTGYKTWTTGDTLTAADLNTTVQSLKTAVESVSQFATVVAPQSPATGNIYNPILINGSSANSSATELQIPMPRDGVVKNVRLTPNSNLVTAACTLTLRKNAADTAIALTVPASSTAIVTTATTVSFVAGDVLSWKMNCGAQQNNLVAFVSFEF